MSEVRCDTVVIGAGAAGIAAAAMLGRAGRRVLMLEARDHAGGRAWSVDVPGSAVPVELGAEFVHGHPEATLRRLRGFGLARVDTAEGSWRMRDGRLERDNDDDGASEALLRRAFEALGPDEDRDVASALRTIARPDEDEAVASVLGMVSGFDAADPRRASVRAIAEEWSGDASLATASARLVDGYRGLWQAETRALTTLPVGMRFGHVVEAIARSAAGVTVKATTPAGDMLRVTADTAIVTLPLGVLQAAAGELGAVAWTPELPAEVRDAFRGLVMGPVVKAMIAFRTPFWEELDGGRYRDGSFFRAPETAPFRVVWTTLPVRSTVLTAWSGGSDVRAPIDGGESAAIAGMLTTIGMLFGADAERRARDEMTWACMHDWQRDPFARGAYSYVAAGGTGARAVLAQPVDGRVFFAGEACAFDGEGGTVAGALMSGEAAAGRVLRRR